MVKFYGYNDGRTIAVHNRKNYIKISFYSLIIIIPITIIGIIKAEYLWFISWALPLFFLFLSALTFVLVKYDDKIFLKGLRTKHLFTVENFKIYIDGKEIKKVNKIRLYKYKNYLFLETSESFFRIPDDEYIIGSRTELLQTLIINKNHTVFFQLPHKTVEEKKDILFSEISLKNKCRLFYSENKDHILYIYKRDDGYFSVGSESLILADDEEINLFDTYGWWGLDSIGISIYETEEMAYNDIKRLIVNYKELKQNTLK